MNKNKLRFFIMIILLICSLFVFSSCDSSDESKDSSIDNTEENKDNYIISLSFGGPINQTLKVIGKANETIYLPVPTYENYSFLYWVDNENNQYQDTYLVSGDVTLTGIWESDELNSLDTLNKDITSFLKSVEDHQNELTIDEEETLFIIYYDYFKLTKEEQEKVLFFDQIRSLIEVVQEKNIVSSIHAQLDKITEDTIYKNQNLLNSLYLQTQLLKYVSLDEETKNKLTLFINELSLMNDFVSEVEAISDTVTIDDKETIDEATYFYQKLNSVCAKQVATYYKILVAKKNDYDALTKDFDNIVLEINSKIAALPLTITYNNKDEIDDITKLINSIDESHQASILYYDEYQNALKTISSIEKDVSTITFCLGDDVYNSKAELSDAFFSDFYKFLLNNYGNQLLTNKGIDNVSDFLEMANDYNGGRDHLYNLGDNFGSYYVTKMNNNILENQSSKQYLGWCYQNNRYTDLLYFLYRFFAYWRIDESCATIETTWADLFDDGWASCVDTCKFFYYDENTSYVKTERMIDCLTFCANVAYGDLPSKLEGTIELDTSLRRRGYTFAGWYDNPEFKGEAVTQITQDGSKKILYAKWDINQDQVDKDQADYAEVMIYNLTTNGATVNETTVGFAQNYYNQLSDHAKTQVLNYDKLVLLQNGLGKSLTNPLVIDVYTNLPSLSFEEMKNEFLKDFNAFSGLSVTNYEEFINNMYTYHVKMRNFFENNAYYTKYACLPSYFLTLDGIAQGTLIQATRIIAFQGKDQEYLTRTIGSYFSQMDASSLAYVTYDFSKPSTLESNHFKIKYFTESIPLTLAYEGYTFKGYYSDSTYQHKVESITDDTPTILYAYFEKIN